MFKDCLFTGVVPPYYKKSTEKKNRIVEAQRDFVVGPDCTVVIKKGERFNIKFDRHGQFIVELSIGYFGICRANPKDWLIIK